MSTLTTTPYNYVFDDVIRVRVSASNSFGSGLVSPTSGNTGARVRSVPAKMAPPTEDPSCTDVKLIINWIALSGVSAGNSAVLAYTLDWDAGVATVPKFEDSPDAPAPYFSTK